MIPYIKRWWKFLFQHRTYTVKHGDSLKNKPSIEDYLKNSTMHDIQITGNFKTNGTFVPTGTTYTAKRRRYGQRLPDSGSNR